LFSQDLWPARPAHKTVASHAYQITLAALEVHPPSSRPLRLTNAEHTTRRRNKTPKTIPAQWSRRAKERAGRTPHEGLLTKTNLFQNTERETRPVAATYPSLTYAHKPTNPKKTDKTHTKKTQNQHFWSEMGGEGGKQTEARF